MHIVFLEIDTDNEWAVCSLGPAFLASVARAGGHTAEMVRVADGLSVEALVDEVRARAPDLIGVSMDTLRDYEKGRIPIRVAVGMLAAALAEGWLTEEQLSS